MAIYEPLSTSQFLCWTPTASILVHLLTPFTPPPVNRTVIVEKGAQTGLTGDICCIFGTVPFF